MLTITLYRLQRIVLLLLGGELLAEHCSIDYLLPSIPVFAFLHAVWTPKLQG